MTGAVPWSVRVLLLGCAALAAGEAGTPVLPSGDLIGRCTEWVVGAGGNVRIAIRDGGTAGDPAGARLVLDLQRRDGANTGAGDNWFFMRRTAPPSPPGADRLRLVLSSDQPGPWVWLTAGVLDGAGWKEYTSAPLAPMPAGAGPAEYILRLDELKAADGTRLDRGRRLCGIALSGRAPIGQLRLHEAGFLLPPAPVERWATAAAQCGNLSGIFERGAPIVFRLGLSGRPRADIPGLAYEVHDHAGVQVAAGELAIGQDAAAELRLPALPTGYYELSLRLPGSGPDRGSESCLKSGGTAPPGRLPFAVMPSTMAGNLDRIRTVGEDAAFFGIHNLRHRYQLHELLGMPWCIMPARWDLREPTRPERGGGSPAPWAQAAMAAPPMPDHLFAFTSFTAQQYSGTPAWAQRPKDNTAPAFRWEEYAGYITDELRVSAHLLPRQRNLLVEGAWEIDLNRPPYTGSPIYRDADIIDLFRRFRPIAKAADPRVQVAGPTYIASSFDQLEPLFALGLLDHLDALSLHCYAPPESLCEKIPRLRRQMEARGRVLPIYNSETGTTSVVAGRPRLREHASLTVRQNIVLKGEGVRAHLTFYPFDWAHEQEGTYGLCFSLDDRLGFDPSALAPKPAAAALAVCVDQLMGAAPVGNLNGWIPTVYGYVFDRAGAPILALWTTGPARVLRLPVGDRQRVEQVGIMGARTGIAVADGMADIALTDEPVYVSGAAPAIYLAPAAGPLRLYPGQSATLPLPAGADRVSAWGLQAAADRSGRQMAIVVPRDCPAGPRAILCTGDDGRSQACWVMVEQPVELVGCRPEQHGTSLDLRLTLRNHAGMPVPVSARASLLGTGAWNAGAVDIAEGADADLVVPLCALDKPLDASRPLGISLDLLVNRLDRQRIDKVLSVLCALRDGGGRPEPPFVSEVQLAGPGSSGAVDGASIRFGWDPSRLLIVIERRDDVDRQDFDGPQMWRGDSVQLAFDTDPDRELTYNPAAGILTKKVSEVTVACPAGGPKVWRHISHNPAELPLGPAAGWDVSWKRDEAAKATSITLGIPWSEIGGPAAIAPGRQIGISILINDLDGPKSERSCLNLFGGINDGKDPARFGRLTLR